MVARRAAAARTVLLACRQWDPRGLARRLPSLGAGAWRGAPLLPWRVQCPGHVCAALAGGSGGSGRCLVSCLPRFPLPAARFLRCVWRAVPLGFPLSSLAGRSFHAVCAFRGLGVIALLVFPACPLWVCALALPPFPRPPPHPWLVWRAHLARSRCWALVEPCHTVRGPPRVLTRSRAPLGLVWGGGAVPFPPYLAWGCVLPVGWVCASWVFERRGLGWRGGGRPVRRSPRLCGRGGQRGRGSPCLGPSLCLPWAGKKAGVLGVAPAMEGVARILLQFMLACCLRARSVWRRCVLARVRLSILFLAGASGWGVEAGPAPASLPGAAFLPGEGGSSPLPRGGLGGRHPRVLRVSGGDGGTGEGVAPWLPTSPSEGGGLRPSAQSPLRRRRIPPRCTRSVGVVGQPRAPAAACHRRTSLAGGGGRGGP